MPNHPRKPPPDNRYQRDLIADYDHCHPVIDRQRIDDIVLQIALRVTHELGPGPIPTVILDLEHLQVADYGRFNGVSESQRAFMHALHIEEPIQPEEMIFLAFRSLFQFVWEAPESEHDIRYAASYDLHLNEVLVGVAIDLAGQFRDAHALLPYWGRLAFLNAMAALPADDAERLGLASAAPWSSAPSSTQPPSAAMGRLSLA